MHSSPIKKIKIQDNNHDNGDSMQDESSHRHRKSTSPTGTVYLQPSNVSSQTALTYLKEIN